MTVLFLNDGWIGVRKTDLSCQDHLEWEPGCVLVVSLWHKKSDVL